MERKQKTARPPAKKRDTSWGAVADWYDAAVEKKGSYQQDLILPNLLRMAGKIEGFSWLDVGCGQGFFCRALAASGARVTGSDVSSEMLARAQDVRADGGGGITYSVAAADDLSFAQKNSFDRASLVLSLQNMERPDAVLAELSRVLVPFGRAYIILNHPAFRIPKGSSWGFDPEENVQYRRIDRYMSESREDIIMHPGKAASAKTISFHRPLQYYFKAFSKNGLAVLRLEEWISNKQSERGPRQKAENIARKEFPLFLSLELEKR